MIGRVYKIFNDEHNILYVGSTMSLLRKRWNNHKSAHNVQSKNGKNFTISIYNYFEEYGIQSFKIETIKEYEIVDKKHLLAYETLWINKLECVNKCIAFNPISVKILDKIRSVIYREKNREKILEKGKIYYNQNKSKLAKRKKIYFEANKNKILLRNKLKYHENKETIKCDCGMEILSRNYQRHIKTKYHLEYFNKDIEIPTNKYRCECGTVLSKVKKARHLKSQRHLNFISQNNS